MPAEFLRDVVLTRDGGRSPRRWSVLPLSIAAHAAVGLAVFIIPLAAEVDLPDPAPLSSRLQIIKARPIPAAPASRRAPVTAPAANAFAAPAVAPDTIEPERHDGREGVDLAGVPGPGVEGGLSLSFGGTPVPPEIVPPPPPPPLPVKQPLRVGNGIREPQKIVHVTPVYPLIARSAAVEGTVVLEAVISTSGTVENVRIIKSVPLLDQAAADAVRAWRYTPTRLNGVPVPLLLTITVRFTLQR